MFWPDISRGIGGDTFVFDNYREMLMKNEFLLVIFFLV
jgi:hypothetical protein